MADNLDGYWRGWLIDDLGAQKNEMLNTIEQAIHDRKIPMYGNRDKDEGVEVVSGTVDMWWRGDTPQLSVKSEMDGAVKASVATQDYGTSLWVHVWFERKDWRKIISYVGDEMPTINQLVRKGRKRQLKKNKVPAQ